MPQTHHPIRGPLPSYAQPQDHLIIASVPAGAPQGLIGLRLIDAGELTVEGTYSCLFYTDSFSNVVVELKPVSVTGTFAPSLQRLLTNGQGVLSTDAGSNFAAGTGQSITATNLRGVSKCRIDFTIPTSGAIDFSPGTDLSDPDAYAEYHGL